MKEKIKNAIRENVIEQTKDVGVTLSTEQIEAVVECGTEIWAPGLYEDFIDCAYEAIVEAQSRNLIPEFDI